MSEGSPGSLPVLAAAARARGLAELLISPVGPEGIRVATVGGGCGECASQLSAKPQCQSPNHSALL